MRFIETHLHALLFAGFWLSLGGYGLSAPRDRIAMLESGLVTQGWHLTALALFLGSPPLLLYWWRMKSPRDLSDR